MTHKIRSIRVTDISLHMDPSVKGGIHLVIDTETKFGKSQADDRVGLIQLKGDLHAENEADFNASMCMVAAVAFDDASDNTRETLESIAETEFFPIFSDRLAAGLQAIGRPPICLKEQEQVY